jgi:hypothetical protein
MKCPVCGAEFKNPTAQAGGRAKVAKGFASPAVLRKALATRKRNARAKRSPNNALTGRRPE